MYVVVVMVVEPDTTFFFNFITHLRRLLYVNASLRITADRKLITYLYSHEHKGLVNLTFCSSENFWSEITRWLVVPDEPKVQIKLSTSKIKYLIICHRDITKKSSYFSIFKKQLQQRMKRMCYHLRFPTRIFHD